MNINQGFEQAKTFAEGKTPKEKLDEIVQMIRKEENSDFIDQSQKDLLLQLTSDYKNKPNLSHVDIETFRNYIGSFYKLD